MQVDLFAGTKKQWNEFASAHGGNHFQSYEWGEFRQALNWEVRRYVVTHNDETYLQALVMRRPLPMGYSLLYSPEGPLVKDADWKDARNQEAFRMLAAELKTWAKEGRALLWKMDPHEPVETFPVDFLQAQGLKDSPENQQSEYVVHVDLSGSEDDVLGRMKQKGRYNIRYAGKKGVTVRKGTAESDLDIFYDLHEQTAKRQGITYRAKEYFATFRQHLMVDSDVAEFFIAEYEDKPMAATLVTYFGRESTYLYGGSTDADRNVFGTYAVQWAGMQEAMKRGCAFYNMTGVAHDDDPNNPWAGLRQFKLRFSENIVQVIGAWDYPFRPVQNFLFTNADRVRRRIVKRSGH